MPEKQQNITIAVIAIIALLIPVIFFISQSVNGKKEVTSTTTPDELVKNDIPTLDEMENIEESKKVEENPVIADNKKMTAEEKTKTQKPTMLIDQNKKYTALLETSAGNITLALNAKETPNTVNNFVYLANLGFYNDVIFHRVINGFMIQSGDPLGSGMGGPAYKFDDEKFSGEYKRGTLAMANAGPNTNGSQFFIMHQDNPLPKNYVIFGNVMEGLDTVDKIATAQVKMSMTGEQSTPVSPVVIKSIKITVE